MTLTFRNPVKMQARRERSLDALVRGDRLMDTFAREMVRSCLPLGPGGPAAPERVTFAVSAYWTRKIAMIRAAYFLQRYGRDFYARQPAAL